MTRPGTQLPPAQLPPAAAQLRERALAAFVLGTLGVIGALLTGQFRPQRGVWVLGLAAVAAGIAIWLGVTVRKQARRDRTARPRGATGGVVLGGVAVALVLLWTLALAMFWSALTDYSSCMGSANTVTATHACQDQLNRSIGTTVTFLHSNH